MNQQLRSLLIFAAGLVVGLALMASWRKPSGNGRADKPPHGTRAPITASGSGSMSANPASGPRVPVDPEATLAELAALEEARVRTAERRQAEGAGNEDSLASALAGLSGAERHEKLREFALLGLEADPEVTLAWMKTLDIADLVAVTDSGSIVLLMAAHDPQTTAQLLNELPQVGQVISKYTALARIWADSDPAAAVAWANSLELDGVGRAALENAFRRWSISDPRSAISHAAGLGNAPLRQNLLADIATNAIREYGVEAVLEWVGEVDDESRVAMLASAMGALGRQDVEASRQLLEKILADPAAMSLAGPMIVRPLENLAAGMFAESPTTAGEWALALEHPDMRQHALEGIAQAWIREDPVGASEWIETLPQGQGRNGAIYYLVENITRTDPATAFQWAASVTAEPGKQRYLLQKSLYQWNAIDPSTASSAIEGLDVPEQTKVFLRAVGRAGE